MNMRALTVTRRSLATLVAMTVMLMASQGLSQPPAPAALASDARPIIPSEPRTPVAATAMTDYVVRPGDTLSSIGERFFTRPENWRQVQSINAIADPRSLRIGSVLRVPNSFFRSNVAEARVIGFRGSVALTRSGASLALRLNQILAEGDIIATGPNAFLRLALSDGGTISVPSNTRLRVDRLRANILTGALEQSFSVLQGRIESRVSSVRPGGGYTVSTPVSVSAVRGTVFRTSFETETGVATSGVLDGSVIVGGRETAPTVGDETISPGLGAVVSQAGVRVEPLPEPAYLVDPDRPQSEAAATFDIIPVQGASTYRAQLATTAGLTEIIAEAQSRAGEARVTFPPLTHGLEDGLYLVAITALTADGLEGPASVYDFLRLRNGLSDLSALPSDDGNHLFQWTSEGSVTPLYRFQLSRTGSDGGETVPFVDLVELKENRVSIPDLAAGTYSWRVRVSRQLKGQTVFQWSEPQALTVSH